MYQYSLHRVTGAGHTASAQYGDGSFSESAIDNDLMIHFQRCTEIISSYNIKGGLSVCLCLVVRPSHFVYIVILAQISAVTGFYLIVC